MSYLQNALNQGWMDMSASYADQVKTVMELLNMGFRALPGGPYDSLNIPGSIQVLNLSSPGNNPRVEVPDQAYRDALSYQPGIRQAIPAQEPQSPSPQSIISDGAGVSEAPFSSAPSLFPIVLIAGLAYWIIKK